MTQMSLLLIYKPSVADFESQGDFYETEKEQIPCCKRRLLIPDSRDHVS
jgi:hypothetical protein